MTGVIGPYILENTSEECVTVNGKRGKQIPDGLFLAKLEATAINYVCFPKDGSTAHVTAVKIDLLKLKFSNQLILRNVHIKWPPRSWNVFEVF